MEKVTVFLSLGSNINPREIHINKTLACLSESLGNFRVSAIYESKPLYVTDQPLFLNCIAQGDCTSSPEQLLDCIKNIEQKTGRTATFRNGPRVIDIDILLFGSACVNRPDLVIPHPEMAKRQFVLIPLVELAPELRHPGTHRLFSEILSEIEPQGVYFHSVSRYTV
ncbi:MAG: 2-amino-4-hydroxy-6-hydroxymethyldihydropteridine diphosphokinase [Spirochaetales bacterium]|nr:2-amino-4-hydroxy-6-hydroxymethyldihydropteridine diphosphokinase [Spirochaetales bacterium]